MRRFILYSLPNIIRVIKLKRIRCVRLAAQAGEKKMNTWGFGEKILREEKS